MGKYEEDIIIQESMLSLTATFTQIVLYTNVQYKCSCMLRKDNLTSARKLSGCKIHFEDTIYRLIGHTHGRICETQLEFLKDW